MNRSHPIRSALPGLRLAAALSLIAASLLLHACRTARAPTAQAFPDPTPAAAAEPVTEPVDDIPASASPVVRAHLIKLKTMLQEGQISLADYESRKELLLSR